MRTIFKLICQAEEKHKELTENQSDKETRIILKKFDLYKERIKEDFTHGEIIRKINIDKNQALLNSFFHKYNHLDLMNRKNFFCCDLTRTNWRMIYTLVRDQPSDTQYILCFMIVDHKTVKNRQTLFNSGS